jgi:hypothetical protein
MNKQTIIEQQKQETVRMFVVFHSKYVQSPLMATVHEGTHDFVMLPADFRQILLALRSNYEFVNMRIIKDGKVGAVKISNEEAQVIMQALMKRFNESKVHMLNCVRKAKTLTTAGQLGKLNGEFHEWYRPRLPAAKSESDNPAAA